MGLIRLPEIFRKKVIATTENRKKVYFQDVDNLYPNRIKALIESSPTAFRSSKLMAKFIIGKGLINEALYDVKIDNALNLNVYQFSMALAKSLANQNGFFVHISYKYDNGEIIPAYSRVLPFEDCRISRTDDDGYFGCLYIKDYDTKSSFNKKDDEKKYYSFTTKQYEILEQIQHCWKEKNKEKDFDLVNAIKSFSGQYYYFNPNIGDIYPLSNIHAVMNDCDTEYRISNYTNGAFRKGLISKNVVMTSGLSDEQEDEVEEVFKNFLGDDNANDLVIFPTDLGDGKTFDDVLKVVQIKPIYDEKFITEVLPQVRKNIMASFNNIPEALVMASDGSLFGTSDGTYEQMKKFYSEQNDEERESIYKFFKDVYNLDVEFLTFGSEISNTSANDEN